MVDIQEGSSQGDGPCTFCSTTGTWRPSDTVDGLAMPHTDGRTDETWYPPLAETPVCFSSKVSTTVACGRSSRYRIGTHFAIIEYEGEDELIERPVFTSTPQTICFDSNDMAQHSVQRVDIPEIAGAFWLTNVLTTEECTQIIALSEAMGYSQYLGGSTLLWMADDTITEPIFKRCQRFFPQKIGGGAVSGLNSRWRIYRYTGTEEFSPHLDGSYPGSGILDERVVSDAFGDRWSQLTFLLYLNSDFEGGETSFLFPHPRRNRCMNIRRVRPAQGSALCFFQQGSPHNSHNAHLSPLHEGTSVRCAGTKYAIRSDVLYQISREVKQ